MSKNYQIYEKVSDYDFLPESNEQQFKEPREFTNVLFKRMSYHFEDGKGKLNDFIIASAFPKQDSSINQNLNLKYHSQKMNLRQTIDKKDDELQQKVRQKSTIDAEDKWLTNQQNPQESLAQYNYILKDDYKSSLEKLDELKINQLRTTGFNQQQRGSFREDKTYQIPNQRNRLSEDQRSTFASKNQDKNVKNFQIVVVQNEQKDNRTTKSIVNGSFLSSKQNPVVQGFEKQTENYQLKIRNNKKEDAENIEDAILSRPNSAFHACSKLSKMYTTQNTNFMISQRQTNQKINQVQQSKSQRRSQSHNLSYISERESQTGFNSSTYGSVAEFYNFNSTNIQNDKIKQKIQRRKISEINPYQKHKFHQVCKKIQSINSVDHYMKMTQEEIDILGKTEENEELKQHNKNEKRIKQINRINISTLKQQQHDQLLKIMDIFQDTKTQFHKTLTKDQANKSNLNTTLQSFSQNKNVSPPPNLRTQQIKTGFSQFTNNSPIIIKRDIVKSNQNTPPQPSPFSINNKIVTINSPIKRSNQSSPCSSNSLSNKSGQVFTFSRKQQDQEDFTQYVDNIEGLDIFINGGGSINTRLKALHLKQSYCKMKNSKQTEPDDTQRGKQSLDSSKITLGLEQKLKLFSYLENDDEIQLNYSKPKKFVRKQVVISQKQKDKVSFVQAVRDQQNQIGIKSLKQKYGKYISKLYEFLQKCICLQICVDDIIEFKVFTSFPFERPGSYVFFKMVKQNQFDYVKNQIQECRWRIFDFDHMMMTALHIAIIKGYKDMAFYLIDKQPDLEAEDVDNKTPLWYAIKTQQFDIAKYLLINHASPWANDNFKYYDIIDDIDMRSSLKVARQLYFLLRCTTYSKRQKLWEDAKNRILDPLVDFKF